MEENLKLFYSIEDVRKDKQTLYQLLDNLGVAYKKTTCGKCLNDLYLIAKEELGLIENAADESDFNGEMVYVYAHPRAVRVNNKVYNKDSKQDDLKYLYELLGSVYVKKKVSK